MTGYGRFMVYKCHYNLDRNYTLRNVCMELGCRKTSDAKFQKETNKCLSQTGGWEDNIANNKRKHIEEETQDQSWIPFSLDPMEYIRLRNPGFPSQCLGQVMLKVGQILTLGVSGHHM